MEAVFPQVMQPLKACCMRILLRFQIGAHCLPAVLGRRTGTPHAQRLCLQGQTPHAMQLYRNQLSLLSAHALHRKVCKTTMLYYTVC